MSYKFSVIKNNPAAFWTLDESSGTSATDYSGLENSGTYSGGLTTGLLPLNFGLSNAYKATSTKYVMLPVDKNFYGANIGEEFGNSSNSDKQFSLEIWIYPSITTNNETTIFADPTNDIGIFYEKGNIVFKCNAEEVSYSLPYFKKSIYVVAVYDLNSILLYIDSELVAQKTLSNFLFTNSSISLSIGPTANASDSFLANSAAVYRYALSRSDIIKHFNANAQIPSIQLAYAEDAEIFEIYDDGISENFTYSYPADKPFQYLLKDGLIYNELKNSLDLEKSTGSKSIVIDDIISIPASLTLDASKVEWYGDNGISVSTSIDGSAYQACTSGEPIPQFRLGNFSTKKNIYIRITFTSSDASKFLPSLHDLSFRFYFNQRKYASNGPDKVSSLYGDITSPSYDISLGQKVYPILSRHNNNGIKCATGTGFEINKSNAVSTFEFFYTPDSLSSEGSLFAFEESGSYPTSLIFWNSSGNLIKNNISKIYVNGIDKSSATNISQLFTAKEIAYVSIVLSNPISGRIVFNYNYSENSANKGLYQNIMFFERQITDQQAEDNYNFYINGGLESIQDSLSPSATVTETGSEYYNNDWLVVQNS